MLLALGQGQLYFQASLAEVHACWNEGQPPLRDLSDEPPDFPTVEQELAGPERLVVLVERVGLRTDMTLH